MEYYKTCKFHTFGTCVVDSNTTITVLEWWKRAAHKLPNMAKLARWSWSV